MRKVDVRGYRPDIDGLRAVAVLLVVLFHMEASLPARISLGGGLGLSVPARLIGLRPTGGFIGVDVFS